MIFAWGVGVGRKIISLQLFLLLLYPVPESYSVAEKAAMTPKFV